MSGPLHVYVTKWRIQREPLRVWDYLGDPPLPVWAAYPPERNRKPYLFATWRSAMDWATR